MIGRKVIETLDVKGNVVISIDSSLVLSTFQSITNMDYLIISFIVEPLAKLLAVTTNQRYPICPIGVSLDLK